MGEIWGRNGRETAVAEWRWGQLSDWDPVPAVLPAGGVSVHDWRTLHGCEYSNGGASG